MYMTKADMMKYGEKYSKSFSKEFSPWKKEFDGMGIKTMLRKLIGKYGVMSIEMADGISKDGDTPGNEYEYLENANSIPVEMDPTPETKGDTDVPENVDPKTGEIKRTFTEEKTGTGVDDKQPELSSAEIDSLLAAADAENPFNK